MNCRYCSKALDDTRPKSMGQFCSYGCQTTYYRHGRKAREELHCDWCNEVIEDKRRFKYCCDDCQKNAKNEKDKLYYKEVSKPKWDAWRNSVDAYLTAEREKAGMEEIKVRCISIEEARLTNNQRAIKQRAKNERANRKKVEHNREEFHQSD